MIKSAAKHPGTASEPGVIHIYLQDGTPDGLRVIDKAGWIGSAALFPRTRFPQLRSRPEMKRTGVYILLGDETGQEPQIYIGEGDPVLNRLVDHFRNKDFWSRAIVFTSHDDSLHKAQLQNLEASLIRMAAAANRCRLVNANTPDEPSISESDKAETKLFLAQLLIILKVLGVEVFDEPAPATIAATLYFLEARGFRAEGYETDSGFVVRRGSEAPKTEAPSTAASIVALRSELRLQRVFTEQADKLVLAQDYSFSSPSQAASALLGRTANGRIEWKTADGRSLKQVQDAAVQ